MTGMGTAAGVTLIAPAAVPRLQLNADFVSKVARIPNPGVDGRRPGPGDSTA